MHIEEDQLVCWMGPNCGSQSIPKHHDKIMEVNFEALMEERFDMTRISSLEVPIKE